MGAEEWKRSWKPWLRGTAFGFPFGALPAGGAEIPTFLSYVTEKRLSRRPEEFGPGTIAIFMVVVVILVWAPDKQVRGIAAQGAECWPVGVAVW